jgi:hypothetical protein
MKNRTMLRMLVLLFLVLLTPYRICAETVVGPVNTSRAREIQANAPKTPEELLIVLKAFFANPDMDGYDFGEKAIGVDKANWGKGIEYQLPFGGGPVIKSISFAIGCFTQTPPVPYQFSTIKLDEQNKLLSFELIHLAQSPNFLLTPAITKKFIGSPTELQITDPTDEFSGGMYYVRYYYKIGTYNLSISFMEKGDTPMSNISFMENDDPGQKLKNKRWHHTDEQIQKERTRRFSFDNHKDFLPVSLRLRRIP